MIGKGWSKYWRGKYIICLFHWLYVLATYFLLSQVIWEYNPPFFCLSFVSEGICCLSGRLGLTCLWSACMMFWCILNSLWGYKCNLCERSSSWASCNCKGYHVPYVWFYHGSGPHNCTSTFCHRTDFVIQVPYCVSQLSVGKGCQNHITIFQVNNGFASFYGIINALHF